MYVYEKTKCIQSKKITYTAMKKQVIVFNDVFIDNLELDQIIIHWQQQKQPPSDSLSPVYLD